MGTWSLTGNALGNTPHGVLGTTDSNALVLETSGAERLRIDAAGNVGINNPSPQGTLDVNGSGIILGLQANGGGQLHIGNNTNDNRIWLEAWSADGTTSATEMLFTGKWGANVPALTIDADTLNVQSTQVWFSLANNGGGRLRIANNPNDNKLYLEAYSADAGSSASEFLLTGFASGPVPQLTLNATNTTVTGTLAAGAISSPTITALENAIVQLSNELTQLQIELSSLAAERVNS
jgi:hypothetical protein